MTIALDLGSPSSVYSETMRSRSSAATVALLVLGMGLLGCNRLKGGSDKTDSSSSAKPPSATAKGGGATVEATNLNDVEFGGRYSKTAEFTMMNGRRVSNATNKGSGSLVLGGGKAIYTQSYPGSDVPTAVVTQTYSYGPGDVKAVSGGFDVTLVFVNMDSNTKNYNPDKNNPKIQARKIAGAGWQIGMLTTDDKGVFAGVEFR